MFHGSKRPLSRRYPGTAAVPQYRPGGTLVGCGVPLDTGVLLGVKGGVV